MDLEFVYAAAPPVATLEPGDPLETKTVRIAFTELVGWFTPTPDSPSSTRPNFCQRWRKSIWRRWWTRITSLLRGSTKNICRHLGRTGDAGSAELILHLDWSWINENGGKLFNHISARPAPS